MDSSRDPDQALVRACQSPDSEGFEPAFAALYEKYRDRVYSIAYRVVGTNADAMDVVQDAFSLLFRKLGSFRFDSLFSTWLFRLVVNCAIDRRRHDRSRGFGRGGTLAPLPQDLDADDPDAPSPFERAASGELEAHIHKSLQKLSPKLRAILVLRYLEHMSYEELAETLKLSMGTVKSRLARAHVAIEGVLRGTLAPFGFDETASQTTDLDEAALGEEGVA